MFDPIKTQPIEGAHLDNPRSRSLRSRLADHGYLLAASGCGIGLLVVGLVDGDQVLGMAFAATGAALLVLWGVQRRDERPGLPGPRFDRDWYWRVYADVLDDLAGGDKISDTRY